MTHALSPSSLRLFEDCGRCFYDQQMYGIARPSGPFPSLPSGMDAVLKRAFNEHRDQGTLPAELAQYEGKARLFADKERLRVWQDNRKGMRWTDPSGNTLYGALDNVLEFTDGTLMVVDYKTRGFPVKADTASHYQLQMDVYNLLLRNSGFRTADQSLLLFYHPTSVEQDGAVRFATTPVYLPVDTQHAQDVFDGAVAILSGDRPECNDACSFCTWRKVSTALPVAKAEKTTRGSSRRQTRFG